MVGRKREVGCRWFSGKREDDGVEKRAAGSSRVFIGTWGLSICPTGQPLSLWSHNMSFVFPTMKMGDGLPQWTNDMGHGMGAAFFMVHSLECVLPNSVAFSIWRFGSSLGILRVQYLFCREWRPPFWFCFHFFSLVASFLSSSVSLLYSFIIFICTFSRTKSQLIPCPKSERIASRPARGL